jgi:hypothetical protein
MRKQGAFAPNDPTVAFTGSFHPDQQRPSGRACGCGTAGSARTALDRSIQCVFNGCVSANLIDERFSPGRL